MTAPHESHYTLAKEADHFTGVATFAIGRPTSRQASRDLRIPEAKIRAFVEELAAMDVINAAYSPFRNHSDDYPSIQKPIATR